MMYAVMLGKNAGYRIYEMPSGVAPNDLEYKYAAIYCESFDSEGQAKAYLDKLVVQNAFCISN